jgi:enoyl-CoA hydratase/carnithine racemase
MTLMTLIISLPLPSDAAINGHVFSAGFMCALCHDKRLMRSGRGVTCTNEVEIGMVIPRSELALFLHKLPINVFFETVHLARHWTGPNALAAGIAHLTHDLTGQY